MSETEIPMDLEGERETLHFLFVCHGVSTTRDNIRYSTITNIDNVSYVAPHGHILHSAHKYYTIKDMILSGDISVTSETIYSSAIPDSNYKKINLPPLMYMPELSSTENQFTRVIGLYIYSRTGKGIHTIKSNAQLVAEYGTAPIMFSRIELAMADYVRNHHKHKPVLSSYNVNLKIYCCRAFRDAPTPNPAPAPAPAPEEEEEEEEEPELIFISRRDTAIPQTTVPVIAEEPPHYIQTPENIVYQHRIKLLGFTREHVSNWSPLLRGTLYQGCGLNVLAAYGDVRTETESRASVLYKTGTSIHKFIDYAALSFQDRTFCAIKFRDPNIAFTICEHILTRVFPNVINPTAIPIKIYWQTPNPDINWEQGHFVTLSAAANGTLIVNDPQLNLSIGFDEYFSTRPINFVSLIFYTIDGYEITPYPFYFDKITQTSTVLLERDAFTMLWGGSKTIDKLLQQNNDITPSEMDKLNKIKYDLIKNYQLTLFCEDEFQMLIPKNEVKHMMPIEGPYTYTPPIKTISLNRLIVKEKGYIKSRKGHSRKSYIKSKPRSMKTRRRKSNMKPYSKVKSKQTRRRPAMRRASYISKKSNSLKSYIPGSSYDNLIEP